MKIYDKNFMKRFSRNLGIPESEFRAKLYHTEQEQNRSFPESFNYDLLVNLTCDEYNITVDEFESDYQYGNIPKTRQMVCFIMSILGARNIQISNITGFKPPRVTNSIRKIESSYDDLIHSENILKSIENE